MSVDSLRQQISERAAELRGPLLVEAGVVAHKRGWKECPCSWCATKREATIVIGTHVPRYKHAYAHSWKEDWREKKRIDYRKRLKALETA